MMLATHTSLTRSKLALCFRVGFDEIAYSLDLCQIHLARFESEPCKFA
jgi:hypothetical protein